VPNKLGIDMLGKSGNLRAGAGVFRVENQREQSIMANRGKSQWLKRVIILIVVGVAIAGGVWYLKNSHEAPPEYQTIAVTRGDLTQAVTATGQVEPVLNVQVGSQISGIVKKLYVDFNSTVKSNQVIAEIDPLTYQVNVLKSEAQLANSKANLTLAKVQAERAESLFTNRLISASDHDTAFAQMQQAEAQVQSDEATLQNTKVQLSYCTIYAPINGVVISRNVDVGQTVAASFNTPTLFVIANDLAKMQIDALVSEADIGGVAVDQDVNFTVDAYPYRTFRGKVSQIRYGAQTNQNVVNYDCVVGVSNSDLKLLPGMTANVSIISAQREGVLKIPNAALRFHPPETPGESKTNAAPRTMAQGGQGGRGGPDGGPRGGGGGGAGGGGGGMGPGGAGGGGPGAGRFGGPGGGAGRGDGAGGGGGRPRAERQLVRTVYLAPAKVNPNDAASAKLKAVQLKVGISDGIMTEVLDGLDEGALVVTGVLLPDSSSRPGAPTANPFGGGGMRRF
jgi:HlyD family secretion protein